MPVNPGSRYPIPTKAQQAVTVIRKNAVLVAYALGLTVGTIQTVVVLLLATR